MFDATLPNNELIVKIVSKPFALSRKVQYLEGLYETYLSCVIDLTRSLPLWHV